MDIKDLGTINGKPISEEMLDSVVSEFEDDWDESATTVHIGMTWDAHKAELLGTGLVTNLPIPIAYKKQQ